MSARGPAKVRMPPTKRRNAAPAPPRPHGTRPPPCPPPPPFRRSGLFHLLAVLTRGGLPTQTPALRRYIPYPPPNEQDAADDPLGDSYRVLVAPVPYRKQCAGMLGGRCPGDGVEPHASIWGAACPWTARQAHAHMRRARARRPQESPALGPCTPGGRVGHLALANLMMEGLGAQGSSQGVSSEAPPPPLLARARPCRNTVTPCFCTFTEPSPCLRKGGGAMVNSIARCLNRLVHSQLGCAVCMICPPSPAPLIVRPLCIRPLGGEVPSLAHWSLLFGTKSTNNLQEITTA